jgi:hypothetical protein
MSLHVVKTKLTAKEAIGKAVDFFGEDGLGLVIVDQDPRCVHFQGGGGRVSVRAVTGNGTTLNLDTSEWDDHVKQFIRQIRELNVQAKTEEVHGETT